MRTLAFVVTLALALALGSAATAAIPSPCSLLTNAEVTKALGSTIESKQEQHVSGYVGRMCQWQSIDLAPPTVYAVRRMLTLQISSSSRADFLKFAERTPGSVRVSGIGDIAFRQGNGNLIELEVWQHGYALSVIANRSASNPLSAEKLAARSALARV